MHLCVCSYGIYVYICEYICVYVCVYGIGVCNVFLYGGVYLYVCVFVWCVCTCVCFCVYVLIRLKTLCSWYSLFSMWIPE